jgi:phage/plasmid-associated DNA primase
MARRRLFFVASHQTLPCEAVTAATDEYRHDEDSFGSFIEERCTIGIVGLQTRAVVLLTAYNKWARDNGIDPASVSWLGTNCEKRATLERRFTVSFPGSELPSMKPSWGDWGDLTLVS